MCTQLGFSSGEVGWSTSFRAPQSLSRPGLCTACAGHRPSIGSPAAWLATGSHQHSASSLQPSSPSGAGVLRGRLGLIAAPAATFSPCSAVWLPRTHLTTKASSHLLLGHPARDSGSGWSEKAGCRTTPCLLNSEGSSVTMQLLQLYPEELGGVQQEETREQLWGPRMDGYCEAH